MSKNISVDASTIENEVLSGDRVLNPESTFKLRQPESGYIHDVYGDSVREYLGNGYKLLTDEEISRHNKIKESGLIGKAAMAGAGVLNSVLLGVPETAARYISPESDSYKNYEEAKKQNPTLAVAAEVGGAIATIPETILAAPAKVLVRASDEIASKVGLKSILGLGDSSISRALLERAKGEGVSGVIKGVVKETAKAAGRGALHGAALSTPSAAIQASFGDPQIAAESILIGGGIGLLAEGSIGGVIAGVKSIPAIGESVAKATEKVLGKGSGNILLDNSGNELGSEIAARADIDHRENIRRMTETLKGMNIPEENLPAEAVFTNPTQIKEAQRAEATKIPFVDENEMVRQKELIRLSAENVVKEKLIPRAERYLKGLSSTEKNAESFIKNAESGLEEKFEESHVMEKHAEGEANRLITSMRKKLGDLTDEEVAQQIEQNFLNKANNDFIPLRREMELSDSVIHDVPTRLSSDSDSFIDPYIEKDLEPYINKINSLDPFESDKNRFAINRAKEILRKNGFIYKDGVLGKIGKPRNKDSIALEKIRNETIKTMKDEAMSGSGTPEKVDIFRKHMAEVLNIKNGKELTDLIKNLRSRRSSKYEGSNTSVYNDMQKAGYTKLINTLEDYSDKIKSYIGNGESIEAKKIALKNWEIRAEKWKPIIRAITGKKGNLSPKSILEIIESGELENKFLKMFESGAFRKVKTLNDHFPEEMAMSADYIMRKIVRDNSFGEKTNLLRIFEKLKDLSELQIKISLGEHGDMFVSHMAKILTSDKIPETKRIIEKLLKKTNNPKRFFEDLKNQRKDILQSAFGKDYQRTIDHLEKHFSREDVRKSITKIEEYLRKNGPNGDLDVVKMIKQISSLPKETQIQIFGISGKKLIDDLNHLFNHTKIEPRGRAGKTISELMIHHYGMTGLAREAIGGFKNIFDIARIQSQKEAYIRAATATEREFQTKNAALALHKTQKIFDSFSVSIDKAFDGKKVNLSNISLSGIQANDLFEKDSEENKFDKNMDILKKMASSGDFIVSKASERADALSVIPSVHVEYVNSLNNLINQMNGIHSKTPPTNKKKFTNLKLKPSLNDIIKLNRKMRVIRNPYVIIEDLSNGIVSTETMAIAESVYPATVKKIKSEITKKIINSDDIEMSFKDRITLSMFLGSDIDGSMQHIAIYNQQAQNSHNQELNQQTKQLKLSGSMMSPAQSIGEA